MNNYESLRPESMPEPKLQASDRRRLDPDLTVQKASQEPVVDTDLGGNRTDAPVTDYLRQGQDDDAQVLRDRVGARLLRPGRTSRARGVASGPRHVVTLGEKSANSDCRQVPTLEVRSTPNGDIYPHLLEEVRQYIMKFTPLLPANEWEAIAPFVHDAIAQAQPTRVDVAKNWMGAVTQLAHYCHFVACIDLTFETVFHADVIERFVQQLDTRYDSSKSTYRSRLFTVASKLIGFQEQSHLRNDIARWEPADAYTVAEVQSLLFAQRTQRTEYRKVAVGVVLALGIGAGITTGEMLRLQQRAVHQDGTNIRLEVLGGERRNARFVPVLTEWVDLLEPALQVSDPAGFVLLPRRPSGSKKANAVSNLLCQCAVFGDVPNTWRMRATWLVAHLNAGTPLPDLMEAAGIDSLAKFERFIPHLNRLPESERSSHMRSVRGTR